MGDRTLLVLFAAAAAVRLVLFTAFPTLPDTLTGRVEISTPVTSFKRLQEGLYLYNHNVPPYDGGIFHQAPLLLPFFSLLPDARLYPLATGLLYIVLDMLSANALVQIAESGAATSMRLFTSPRKDLKYKSVAVAASFLFNPLVIATCLARPTSAFTNTFTLLAISHACGGRSVSLLLTLGIASYLALHPIFLFPPLALLCYDQRFKSASPPRPVYFATSHIVGFASILGALLYASYRITGSSQFIHATYGTRLLLPDLTPNVGLWWYFFIEMFDSFREFFLGVFWLHMFSYVGALTIRIRKQPLFVATSLVGVMAVFQPYPSIADSALFLALVPLYRHVFPLMRYPFLETAVLLYATLLGPAFYHLWIYAGSGNANFFYAITLVWSLGLVLVVADLIYAVLRDEWEEQRPDMKGKEVRQI